MKRISSLLALVLLCAASAPAQGSEDAPPLNYPLDAIARVLEPGARLPCEHGEVELQSYRGTLLSYSSPLRVHPAFAARLPAFEEIVREVSLATYGRAPKRIVHLGSYNCRRMRRYNDWVSEHALGNALDVAGFDFEPAKRSDLPPVQLPKALRRGFQVRMDKHWTKTSGMNAIHAQFLHALAQKLIERSDVFSVVLGPAWPGHHNHLHLDRAPYRVVEVFEPSISTR